MNFPYEVIRIEIYLIGGDKRSWRIFNRKESRELLESCRQGDTIKIRNLGDFKVYSMPTYLYDKGMSAMWDRPLYIMKLYCEEVKSNAS